jgi:hypothetical protein
LARTFRFLGFDLRFVDRTVRPNYVRLDVAERVELSALSELGTPKPRSSRNLTQQSVDAINRTLSGRDAGFVGSASGGLEDCLVVTGLPTTRSVPFFMSTE